jgi:DNA-binding beta-propeller fold protein YncE
LSTGELQFNTPHGLALDAKKNLYVADSMNHRVKVFDESQIPIGTLGSEGPASSQFIEPAGLYIDDETEDQPFQVVSLNKHS